MKELLDWSQRLREKQGLVPDVREGETRECMEYLCKLWEEKTGSHSAYMNRAFMIREARARFGVDLT